MVVERGKRVDQKRFEVVVDLRWDFAVITDLEFEIVVIEMALMLNEVDLHRNLVARRLVVEGDCFGDVGRAVMGSLVSVRPVKGIMMDFQVCSGELRSQRKSLY